MDYKELVKSLRICAGGGGCAGCIQNSKFSPICVDTLLSQAADAIQELSNPGWISVTEGLPEDDQKILVYVKRRGTEFIEVDQFCDDSDGTYLSSGYEIVEEVTHWMPLPEPPKEDE